MQEEKEYKLTKNGIAHNLNFSPYIYRIEYNDYYLDYVFSSELNLTKFIKRYIDYRIRCNEGLIHQYRIHFLLDLDILWDLKIYESIEKRGFKVVKNDEVDICKDFLKLGGLKLTIQDLEVV